MKDLPKYFFPTLPQTSEKKKKKQTKFLWEKWFPKFFMILRFCNYSRDRYEVKLAWLDQEGSRAHPQYPPGWLIVWCCHLVRWEILGEDNMVERVLNSLYMLSLKKLRFMEVDMSRLVSLKFRAEVRARARELKAISK